MPESKTAPASRKRLPNYLQGVALRGWVSRGSTTVGVIPRPAVELVLPQRSNQLNPKRVFRSGSDDQAQLRGEVAAQSAELRARILRDFPEWRGARGGGEITRLVGYLLIKAELLAEATALQGFGDELDPRSSAAIGAAYDRVVSGLVRENGNDRATEIAPPSGLPDSSVVRPASELVSGQPRGFARLLRSVRLGARRSTPDVFTEEASDQALHRGELAACDRLLGPKIRAEFGLSASEPVPRIVLRDVGYRILLAELLVEGNRSKAVEGESAQPAPPISSEALSDAYDRIMGAVHPPSPSKSVVQVNREL